MGKASKIKGSRVERELVNRHRAAGITAERVPLSGAHPSHPGDVLVTVAGRTLQCESKRAATATDSKRWKPGWAQTTCCS